MQRQSVGELVKKIKRRNLGDLKRRRRRPKVIGKAKVENNKRNLELQINMVDNRNECRKRINVDDH